MALRQREWVIYVRPYYVRSVGSGGSYKVDYMGAPQARASDVGETGSYTRGLKGMGEGGGETDEGGWVMWLKTGSFKELREKYKELLESTAVEHIRIAELVNVDTMITPIS